MLRMAQAAWISLLAERPPYRAGSSAVSARSPVASWERLSLPENQGPLNFSIHCSLCSAPPFALLRVFCSRWELRCCRIAHFLLAYNIKAGVL